MDILKKFTKKNLKLNKKRTIVTIIGIMLSTALICAVAGMVSSTQKTLANAMRADHGNYHMRFENVPAEELKFIEENVNVESYFLTKNVGYAKLDGSINPGKPYLFLMEFDRNALQNSSFKIVEGRLPENENEVVISQHIIDNGGVELKVGDTLSLDVGTRRLVDDGSVLSQSNPYLGEEESQEENLQEEITDTINKTYTIVGIIERPSYELEDYQAPGYTIITYSDNINNTDTANISVLFNNVGDYEETTEQIVNTVKEDTGVDISAVANVNVIRFDGGLSENTMNVLYGIAGVIIVIIVVSSVFVIRNSFAISVAEKTKQYGMLASVGATKKQIRKTVLLEGTYIGAIAIPLGILCGIIAIVVLLWIVNYLIGDMMDGVVFIYNVPLLPILLSIVISAITIYLSCIIPAIRASRISPIEAIRGNEDIKIKAKKIKTSKLTKKIFGIGGVIASKNLKRNKKKYRTTVISLVVSIAIFISLSSFLDYGKRAVGLYYTDMKYNVDVYNGDIELYNEIAQLNNIDDYSYSFTTSAIIDIEKYGSEYGKEISNINRTYYEEAERETEYQDTIAVIMFNNNYFKKFIKELGLNENDYKNIAILEDDEFEYNEDGTSVLRNYYNIKEGETITINLNGEERQVTIAKRSDQRPMGFEGSYATGGWIFVSEDFMEDKENEVITTGMYINSSDASQLERDINNIIADNDSYKNVHITNLAEFADQERRILLLVSIFLYGFITVITLIGVTNIFNTITTNMILRSKEFANLKSIGMTTKEFNKMIRLESLLYGLKSLLIGIPIGLFGSFCIYQAFKNSVDFGYMIPWVSILISIIFVFIIVGATMKYSLSKINKQNIIETIRQDNI